MSDSIFNVWAVTEGDGERSIGQPKWFFQNKEDAENVAQGKGWWGGKATIVRYSVGIINEQYYLLADDSPIVIGYTEDILDKKIRQQALNKLNAEEKRVLGV